MPEATTSVEPWTSGTLLERLQRHYIDPGQAFPGGIFTHEVGWNGNAAGSTRCDAIYIGFTATSGRLMVGHEIKVSRSDWRRELDKKSKADRWHDACHAWYIVAPSSDIVPVEELPAGWGLLVPNPRSKVRMQVVVKATERTEHQPPWPAVRSVLARYDTLRAEAIYQATQQAKDKAREQALEQIRQSGRPLITPAQESRLAALDILEEVLGVAVTEWRHRYRDAIPAEQLGAALLLVERMGNLPDDTDVNAAVKNAERLSRVWTEIGQQVEQLRTQIGYPTKESA